MRPKVGISACLMGERVRYDGGHREASDLVSHLAREVELIAVCPEVGAGMGVPREPFHLEERGARLVAITNHSARDVTEPLQSFARREVERLARLGLHGFVSKARSPSCGLRDTPLVRPEHTDVTTGLFITELRRRLPELPVATDATLAAPAARIAFIARVLDAAGASAAGSR